MSDKTEEKKTEHKVGENLYALRGRIEAEFVIVGAPRVGKVRWVTIAPIYGGLLQSFPEDVFDKTYWIVGTNGE